MIGLGAVLGWKHHHEPGIETKDGVLTAWPSSLGAFPTQTQLDTWTAEFITAGVEQRQIDTVKLVAAGKDVALVLVELIDWLLANTTMQSTAFTSEVRQAYLDLKNIADRVKS